MSPAPAGQEKNISVVMAHDTRYPERSRGIKSAMGRRYRKMGLERKIKAVIFDMDGVISDTQIIHSQTESELLKSYGIEMHPDEITRKYAGVSNKEMFPEIFDNAHKEMPPLELLVEKKWRIIEDLVRGNVKEINGTREFIDSCRAHGIPLAVGSASRLIFIELVLQELGLWQKFDAITSAEEVKKGKPAPDLFLLAAARLSIAPENCVVIEDGISGMIAAKRAGMQCIGLVEDDKRQNYPADVLVLNLRDIAIKKYIYTL